MSSNGFQSKILKILNFEKRLSYAVGVDIGSSSVKIVGIKLAKTPGLAFYSIIDLPEVHDDAFISTAITNVLKEKKISKKSAVLTFSGESIIFRRVELPAMPANEVQEALKWKEKETISFNLEEAYTTYALLKENQKEDGSKTREYIFIAIQKEAMDKKIELLKGVGLDVVSVGAHPIGIDNLLKADAETHTDKIIMVADIGFEKTEMVIFKDGSLEFVRSVPVGSNNITAALQGALSTESGENVQFTKEEAEGLKRKIGIAYEEVALDKGIRSIQALSLMRPVLEQLSKEIKRSMEYYVHEYGAGADTIHLYLTGGGSRLKNLDKYLTEELNVPVKKMDIPKSINTQGAELKEDDAPSLAALIGVVLGYRGHLNLLPQKYRLEKLEFVEKVLLRMAIVITAVILGASLFFIKLETKDYEDRLKNIPYERDLLSNVKDLHDRVSERENFLLKAKGASLDFERIMKELSNIVPDGVVLGSLKINGKDGTLNMEGSFYGPRTSAEAVLTKFMETIEKSGCFKEAELSSVQGEEGGKEAISTFGITCSVK